MSEETIKLAIPHLLPGLDNKWHEYVPKLEQEISSGPGIERVHIVENGRPAAMCIHYNSELVTPTTVRQLATQAGTQAIAKQSSP